ncbi:hypothetical protein V8C44DRAFT_315248 [Trichoderma aethiopicum]
MTRLSEISAKIHLISVRAWGLLSLAAEQTAHADESNPAMAQSAASQSCAHVFPKRLQIILPLAHPPRSNQRSPTSERFGGHGG